MGPETYTSEGQIGKRASDEQLYFLAEHWKEDLAYFKDEIHFLFILTKKDSLSIAMAEGGLKEELSNLHLQREALAAKINTHLHDFAAIEGEVLYQEGWKFRSEHDKIETEFAGFWKAFRTIKSKIFKLAGEMIRYNNRIMKIGLTNECD